jgi:alkanesulfonate monooxygenase SsuD/methylene tetrahydromethanopterin reductase-like flavin-dependent oxidoreductase (luciferase family)
VAHQLGSSAAWDAGADTPDLDELRPVVPDEAQMRGWTVAGSPEDVVRALRPTLEAFGERDELHLIVRLHYPDMDFETAARAVELFAADVVPALRGE